MLAKSYPQLGVSAVVGPCHSLKENTQGHKSQERRSDDDQATSIDY